MSYPNTNYAKLEAYIKARKTKGNDRIIYLNSRLVKDILGYDDMRDLFYALGNWGHNTDFTYNERPTENAQAYLMAFLESFLE